MRSGLNIEMNINNLARDLRYTNGLRKLGGLLVSPSFNVELNVDKLRQDLKLFRLEKLG